MTAPLYRQTGKVQHISANGSYMLNRRRCIECDTYRDLMHFAADSRVCDACAVAIAGGAELPQEAERPFLVLIVTIQFLSKFPPFISTIFHTKKRRNFQPAAESLLLRWK